MVADLFEAAMRVDGLSLIAAIIRKATGLPTTSAWLLERGEIVDMSLTDDIREAQAAYIAYYHKLDPWQRDGQLYPDQIRSESIHARELVRTEFYNDFARKLGMMNPLGMVLRIGPESLASFGLNRPGSSAPYAADEKARLAQLMPYLRRAIQLRLRQQPTLAALPNVALDALAFGTVICNAEARVMLVNGAAERLAQAGAGIVFAVSGLSARIAPESRMLARLIRDAAQGGSGGVMRLTGRSEATELLVLVTPLPREAFGDHGPGYALVSMREAKDRPAFTQAVLASMFGLSPTQAALAMAIYRGQPTEEIAAEFGIKLTTLRTHLDEIFRRTGAENRQDLLRLLSRLPQVRTAAD